MGNKKIFKEIRKSNRTNAELIDALRRIIAINDVVPRKKPDKEINSKVKRQDSSSSTVAHNQRIAKMIGELYEDSGTSGSTGGYPYAVGEDAYMLRRVQDRLMSNLPISKDEANIVLRVYKKAFPKNAYENSF